ncbi:MAG: protein-L-isoaspartate(D-aspartate) O-methyltransferase [Pseudomonadota bacterium]|nr:protein-L-isoaspartate(D-aspartate) O-methyltransferase [Pseudomonadota bacterium]
MFADRASFQLQSERLMQTLSDLGIRKDVLDAMAKVPRDAFLAPAFKHEAYKDAALPIGESQTISQPKVVALMTHALDVAKNHKVLEIGTGCGYQTAVLCKMARRVFTVERFESLSESADKRLQQLAVSNYVRQVGDGSLGWVGQAPFDRIMVTATSPQPPQALLDQLGEDGVMVIPIGKQEDEFQRLMRYYRRTDGSIGEYYLGDVRFVPLVGKQGVTAEAG